MLTSRTKKENKEKHLEASQTRINLTITQRQHRKMYKPLLFAYEPIICLFYTIAHKYILSFIGNHPTDEDSKRKWTTDQDGSLQEKYTMYKTLS